MAVPTLDIPYTPQVYTVLDAISLDISTNWSNATSFDVASVPPDTSYVAATTTIAGTASTQMVYTVYIRGRNSDGAAAWAPLLLTTTGQTTERTLYGLSQNWALVHSAGSTAVIYIKQATKNVPGTGVMLINDIDNDGNASTNPPSALFSQIVLNGGSATWLRATQPGWEVIIDVAQAI